MGMPCRRPWTSWGSPLCAVRWMWPCRWQPAWSGMGSASRRSPNRVLRWGTHGEPMGNPKLSNVIWSLTNHGYWKICLVKSIDGPTFDNIWVIIQVVILTHFECGKQMGRRGKHGYARFGRVLMSTKVGGCYACHGEPCRVNSNERQHRMVGSREQLYFIFSGQLWVLWVMIQYDILICIMLWPQMTLDSAGGLWGKITAIRTDYIEPLGVSIFVQITLSNQR